MRLDAGLSTLGWRVGMSVGIVLLTAVGRPSPVCFELCQGRGTELSTGKQAITCVFISLCSCLWIGCNLWFTAPTLTFPR